MGRFFSGWATWEKLCFILACAIVVTILLGAAKLGYTHWKLRKYTAVAEKEKKEQAVQRQMSQRRRTQLSEGADVPFGIRAIESGIEVDGVWISRNNTPEPATRETSASSSSWGHVPRKEYDVEKMAQQQFYDRSGSDSTAGTARPPSSAVERAVVAERPASTNTSRDPSPDEPIAKPPKSRHPPSSLSKFSTNPYLLRQDSATNTIQGIEAVFHAAGPMRSDYGFGEDSSGSNGSSNQSTFDSTDTEPIAASAPRLLNQQARPRNRSKDLDLMHSHRMSQAAETGQFTPRTRQQSGDLEYFVQPAVARERGNSAQESVVSPLMTPKVEALPAAIRRSSLPDVTPFAKFCQTAPPSPSASRPSSADGFSALHVRGESNGTYVTAPPSPSALAHAIELPATEPARQGSQPRPQQQKRGSFEHRKSDVIRGHGSGFEILRPGSLNPKMPCDQPAEKHAGPPISLHNSNSSRPRSTSADSRKKLQKKRQPSADSRRSSETASAHRASVI